MLPIVLMLAMLALGGVAFAFTGGDGSAAKAIKRIGAIEPGGKLERARRATNDVATRRKQIVTSLKAAEKQQRKTSLTLENRLLQAGLKPNVRGFWLVSLGIAAGGFLVGLIVTHNPLIGLGVGFAGGGGLPRWWLGFLAKRRVKKFTAAFPDATDVIVRGIKSGLPVHDCLKIIASESPKPLDDEMRQVVESLGMGMTMEQALEKMSARMPTSEVRFFAIVLGIQSKSGGNLAEALNNLSVVLRARKLMKEKIKAMAGEAVASAGIIGALPPIILVLVQLTTPSYMKPLYVTQEGHIFLMIGAVWMTFGILVMRKMINFKF
jgi:tight adherence protein B